MPTTPEYTQLSLAQRLTEHARTAWPQLTDLHIRHRGQCVYVEGELADGWLCSRVSTAVVHGSGRHPGSRIVDVHEY
jgi:hypothetical protein